MKPEVTEYWAWEKFLLTDKGEPERYYLDSGCYEDEFGRYCDADKNLIDNLTRYGRNGLKFVGHSINLWLVRVTKCVYDENTSVVITQKHSHCILAFQDQRLLSDSRIKKIVKGKTTLTAKDFK